jgi:hypothetical protein
LQLSLAFTPTPPCKLIPLAMVLFYPQEIAHETSGCNEFMSSDVYMYILSYKFVSANAQTPVPVAARSKTQVCCRPSAEFVGSNPGGVMDVSLLFCVVTRRADHSSREVLMSVVCRA